MKIGHKMLVVTSYVADHPGCCKLDAGKYQWHNMYGNMSYLYGPVNRAIKVGLIESVPEKNERGNAYYLEVTDYGRKVLSAS